MGYSPRFFFARIFFWDLYILTTGSYLGTLKKVRTDSFCSLRRIETHRKGGRSREWEIGVEGVNFIFHF